MLEDSQLSVQTKVQFHQVVPYITPTQLKLQRMGWYIDAQKTGKPMQVTICIMFVATIWLC